MMDGCANYAMDELSETRDWVQNLLTGGDKQ